MLFCWNSFDNKKKINSAILQNQHELIGTISLLFRVNKLVNMIQ